ncbi:DUF4062 domain-containing protein [Bradyrhizobium symbiodeficiens]|uniref:DUF4062 domain-containing protein n=1 Tax=Bradyrhizobium symbiodeficiens TaxID=1404367 RepID=UPI00140FC337|nr:DUF4062 domain-containing protein [Bradyrhizobium symbiodeficiens]QIO98468.1 DUF4062 domain-containing protein [Bradyrhizobium symbiodeficiens]
MAQKKYQVFISSTFKDLSEERQDTLKSVLDMGHIPSGMEIFPAVDIEQFEYIKKIIDECDYYVLIVAARYGSVDQAGVSYTEKEYRYAVSQKKTVLAFIHSDLGNIPTNKSDGEQLLQEKLTAFRQDIAKSRLVQFWGAREDLKAKVIISLHKAISEYPAIGWMRANVAASEDLLSQINQLRLENEELRSKNAPAFDGVDQLADFDSKFAIRYGFDEWNSLTKTFDAKNGSFTIDWKSLFVLIAPQFTRPRPEIIFSELVKGLIEDRYIPRGRQSIDLYSTDMSTVEAQYHAYGLLESEAGVNLKGGATRFITLTPLGRRRQLEWSTVRASAEPASE